MIFQITYKLIINFTPVNLLGWQFRCTLWLYLSSPLWMMSCSSVSFAEDRRYSTCYYTALMICLSIPGRMESNAALFWHSNLPSEWQKNSNGRTERNPNPFGSPWELSRRMQIFLWFFVALVFFFKSPILLDLPGVVALFIFKANEDPLWIMLFELCGACLD